MVLAEKCPNCNAFLPVRRPGVSVRRCNFCDLEVPGDTRVFEVPALTPVTASAERLAFLAVLRARAAVRATGGEAGQPSTWLPPGPAAPPRREGVAPRRSKAWLVALILLAGGIGLIVVSRPKRDLPRTSVATPPPADAAPPPEDPRVVAARAAFQAAGGAAALDPVAYLAHAEQLARARAADASLTEINLRSVREDGHADLTLPGSPYVHFDFRSPASSRRPADAPVGVAARLPCMLVVHATAERPAQEADVHEQSPAGCRNALLEAPSCTPADIWKRARADGAPAGAIARLLLKVRPRSPGDPEDDRDVDQPEPGVWFFTIEMDDGSRDFSRRYPDDCGRPPPPVLPAATEKRLQSLAPALHACFRQAAGAHAAVEAFDLRWQLEVAADGRVTPSRFYAAVDIEGVFVGSLGGVRSLFTTCSQAALGKLRLPGPGSLALWGRLTRDGRLSFATSPPP